MTQSINNDREQRILDAASELFVHYGYDKTTVSDIARAAGVSKGAIYLHVDSKETLLEKLIMREMFVYGEAWLNRLDEDPNGGTIAGMYKNTLYALNSSPLMMAIFKQDNRILGTYLRRPDNIFRRLREGQTETDRTTFVRLMQEAGAVRTDIPANVVGHIMDMLAYGLVGMGDIMDQHAIPPMEAVIEGIALLMDKALTPEDGGNPERAKEIVRQIADTVRAQFAAMKEADEDANTN